MKYTAEDGKSFDNITDCIEYEKLPKLYLVHETSNNIAFQSVPSQIFLTREEAEIYVSKHENDYTELSIKTKIFPPLGQLPTGASREKTHKIQNKRDVNWKNIVEYLSLMAK